MAKFIKSLAAVLVFSAVCAPAANAAESSFTAIPTNWRLEEYNNGIIAVYFTPSQCASGKVLLTSASSNEMKNRFWSTIMTAKIARKHIGIFYDTTTCEVTHYFLAEEPLL